jgi:predicted nucleic acid-binding protein
VVTKRHSRGVLDTSTLIQLNRVDDAHALPDEPLITTITLAELSVGPLLAASDDERAKRQAHLQEAAGDFEPIPFDSAAARAFAQVAASLRTAGRKRTARSFDALIAAIAVSHELPVYTCNPDDFAQIDGLDVVPVVIPSR